MVVHGKLVAYDGNTILIRPDAQISREIIRKNVHDVELRFNDGRTITNDQRKKIYAMIGDFARYTGYSPEDAKEWLKYFFIRDKNADYFSLSNTSVTNAREFIDYLVDFFFENDIPTRSPMIEQADDINRYLYHCLEHRKCAVCNAPAEVHHVDRIGMGRDREAIVHVGLRAIALCWKHHNEAHQDERKFLELHHIYGIKLDEYLCSILNLNTKEKK